MQASLLEILICGDCMNFNSPHDPSKSLDPMGCFMGPQKGTHTVINIRNKR